MTFGNAPNTSAPVTQRYVLETGNTFEHAFPLRGQNHSELMTARQARLAALALQCGAVTVAGSQRAA